MKFEAIRGVALFNNLPLKGNASPGKIAARRLLLAAAAKASSPWHSLPVSSVSGHLPFIPPVSGVSWASLTTGGRLGSTSLRVA